LFGLLKYIKGKNCFELYFNCILAIILILRMLTYNHHNKPHNIIVDKDDLPGRLTNDLVSSRYEVPDTLKDSKYGR